MNVSKSLCCVTRDSLLDFLSEEVCRMELSNACQQCLRITGIPASVKTIRICETLQPFYLEKPLNQCREADVGRKDS